MIYHLYYLLLSSQSSPSVYAVGFRVTAALFTAVVAAFFLGSWFLKHAVYFRAAAREDTPERHQAKNNTPTMGGIIILVATFISSLLWTDLTHPEVWIFLLCLAGFGAIGFWDDWKKIRYKKGIKDRHKSFAQLCVGTLVVLLWYLSVVPATEVSLPFLKGLSPALGLLLIPWAVFIIVGTSNAVNLTDGLDGLATSSLISTFGTFTLFCILAGTPLWAVYFSIPYTTTLEIAIIGGAVLGSLLVFLWYNAHPAEIFMGDVGSLALGAGMALMALMLRQELLLALAGGLFVAETVSVMLQVLYYKKYTQRLFRMAPIHHHFELLGWPETKITTRLSSITQLLCFITLMSLFF